MMPGMDGFEVCRRLKADPATHHIPVVLVTALDSPSDRMRGLEAGADDFLTKPVSDVVLFARVRSLTRLKMMIDELRMRAHHLARDRRAGAGAQRGRGTGRAGGSCWSTTARRPTSGSRALLRSSTRSMSRPTRRRRCFSRRGQLRPADRLARPRQFRRPAAAQPGALAGAHAPCADPGDRRSRRQPRLLHGLEIGVNDYLLRPIDPNELLARARTQIASAATPIICATTWRTRSRWRSPTR